MRLDDRRILVLALALPILGACSTTSDVPKPTRTASSAPTAAPQRPPAGDKVQAVVGGKGIPGLSSTMPDMPASQGDDAGSQLSAISRKALSTPDSNSRRVTMTTPQGSSAWGGSEAPAAVAATGEVVVADREVVAPIVGQSPQPPAPPSTTTAAAQPADALAAAMASIAAPGAPPAQVASNVPVVPVAMPAPSLPRVVAPLPGPPPARSIVMLSGPAAIVADPPRSSVAPQATSVAVPRKTPHLKPNDPIRLGRKRF